MEHSQFFGLSVKSVSEAGVFEGHASTFGNEDLQGDIVDPGAFLRTLKGSGGRVPVLMGHQGIHIVGFGTDAKEDGNGLLVRAEFTLDSDDGRNAYALAKHAQKLGHKLGLSIGYGVPDGGSKVKNGVRHLTDLDLYEYSIAAIPANPRARISNVKTADGGLLEALRAAGFASEAAKLFGPRI